VIISEKRDKKAAKYLTKDLPYPYTSKAQFERTLEMPIGKEWNTRIATQRATLPKVTKKVRNEFRSERTPSRLTANCIFRWEQLSGPWRNDSSPNNVVHLVAWPLTSFANVRWHTHVQEILPEHSSTDVVNQCNGDNEGDRIGKGQQALAQFITQQYLIQLVWIVH
jgi:Utp14 protein